MFKRKNSQIKEIAIEQPIKSKPELIFEAAVRRVDAPTIFYYVIQDEEKYYFKSGISIIGAPIRPDEDYRLNIDVKSSFHYDNMKSQLLRNSHVYKYFGAIDCAVVYFNFLKETSDATNENNRQKVNQNVLSHLEFAFDIGLDMRIKESEYTVIDSFSVNTKLYRIIHSKKYPHQIKKESKSFSKEELEDLKTQYTKQFDIYDDKILSKAISKTVMYGYGDLMSEALFIKETGAFPEQPLVVHGWTGRDLIEGVGMKTCEAYYILSMMRTSLSDCKERLRSMLSEFWPKLFDKEFELENAIKNNSQVPVDEFTMTRTQTKRRQEVHELKKSVLSDLHKKFLSIYTVNDIENDLKKYVIGQDNLIRQVALFLYYHILRQVKPELHNRPMLISGPSGSGKTEIWRVVKKLYKDYISVEIVDGSSITQDGWSGQRKLATCLEALDTATIFVVDEFDKLASPAFSKGGDNVSHHIQSEFLKLLEGDYTTTGIKAKEEISINYDCSTLGLVLVGAFEKIRSEKEQDGSGIGFIRQMSENLDEIVEITDEDLVEFGVMPEIVGRIASKCTTNKLTAQQYLEIIRNDNSKVSVLMNELQELGIDVSDCINDDIVMELTKKSQINLLGVRWVSSQIENLLLQKLAHSDIRELFKDSGTTFLEAASEINKKLDEEEAISEDFYL